MMRNGLAFASMMLCAAAGVGLAPSPAHAQSSTRILTIFGNDKCPTSNGEEIVVCNRLPEGDRFRIPEQLRTAESDGVTSAAARVDVMQAGNSGIGNCSPTGAGGQVGCFKEIARQARAEKKAKAKEVTIIE